MGGRVGEWAGADNLWEENMSDETEKKKASGYHMGDVDTVISVEDVNKQAKAMAEPVTLDRIAELAGNDPFVTIENLRAGSGKMQIMHDLNLPVAKCR